MLRRSLIAGAAIATLTGEITMSDTAEAQTKSDPENTLYMDLKQGRVVIQMFPDIAPKAVERVKTLTREGFYDNTPFHRVIEGFMAQGGDPTGTGSGGSKLPDLPAEFSTKRHFLRGTVGSGADLGSEQREQSVLHHVRAGAASGRAVHDLGPGDAGDGIHRPDQARQRLRRHGAESGPDRAHAGGGRRERLTARAAWRFKAAGEPVAQVVEHETFNLGAVGSSPTGLTNYTNKLLSDVILQTRLWVTSWVTCGGSAVVDEAEIALIVFYRVGYGGARRACCHAPWWSLSNGA